MARCCLNALMMCLHAHVDKSQSGGGLRPVGNADGRKANGHNPANLKRGVFMSKQEKLEILKAIGAKVALKRSIEANKAMKSC